MKIPGLLCEPLGNLINPSLPFVPLETFVSDVETSVSHSISFGLRTLGEILGNSLRNYGDLWEQLQNLFVIPFNSCKPLCFLEPLGILWEPPENLQRSVALGTSDYLEKKPLETNKEQLQEFSVIMLLHFGKFSWKVILVSNTEHGTLKYKFCLYDNLIQILL